VATREAPQRANVAYAPQRANVAYYWLDVGRLSDLEKANRDVAEGLLE
jgi:hypothetical protein